MPGCMSSVDIQVDLYGEVCQTQEDCGGAGSGLRPRETSTHGPPRVRNPGSSRRRSRKLEKRWNPLGPRALEVWVDRSDNDPTVLSNHPVSAEPQPFIGRQCPVEQEPRRN